MQIGTLTLLYKTGQIVEDSWTFNSTTPEETLKKLRLVAQSRRSLLASNISIVLLKVTGLPLERVDLQGTAGGFAWTSDSLILRHDGYAYKKQLRGVPREIYKRDGLTPLGHQAFRDFNRTLNQCGCMIVTKNFPPELIHNLVPDGTSYVTRKRTPVATKTKLLTLLGPEKGQLFWEAMKAAKENRGPA